MNWGIIATGSIAGKFAATVNAMAGEGERLCAVASRDEARAKAFAAAHNIPKAYGSYEELLSDGTVDAVYIATPNNMHYSNASACLRAGKHVLCEKPFTTCAADAARLYALAEGKGLFIMEAFWIAFLPLYDELKKIIRSREYGLLRHVRLEYGFIARGARRGRKFDAAFGGGALLDIGIYNLGFLRLVTGANPEVFSSYVRMNEFGTDEFSAIQLRYPGGITAHSVQTIGMQIERHAALFFDGATIYLPDFQHACRMTVKPAEGEGREIERPFGINGFEYQIREVTRCARAGKYYSNVFRPGDSVATISLMDDIRKSWNMKFPFEK